MKAENKRKHSSSVGPKCEQARPGKLAGARTTLFIGVNGISRLSAGNEAIKKKL